MKRIALLVILLAAIVGGALLLNRKIFPQDDNQLLDNSINDAQSSTSAAQTQAGPEDASLADNDSEDAGSQKISARVLDIRGVAQRRTADGRWIKLGNDEKLSLDDTVRTLSGGSLRLNLGDAVGVRLTPRTEVTIRELTEQASRVRLEEGRIVAEVDPEGRTVLRVEAKGTQAQVEARGGVFSMISDGHGQVAVASSVGVVNLTAAGKSVTVAEGQTASVTGDSAPSRPQQIPGSLFLKVKAPRRNIQRESRTVVSGRSTPGSLVRIGKQVAMADSAGQFRISVPLREGPNELEVSVTDVNGRDRTQKLPAITVDTREPAIENTEVNWGETKNK